MFETANQIIKWWFQNMKVNGKDDIPYMKWKIKTMSETTNKKIHGSSGGSSREKSVQSQNQRTILANLKSFTKLNGSVILGMIPCTFTLIPLMENSEVVIIYPESWKNMGYNVI